MKRLATVAVLLGILVPSAARAQSYPVYVMGKFGAYVPTGDLDDIGFDSSFNFEAAFGAHFGPNFVLEGSTGYFHSDLDEVDPLLLLEGEFDVGVVPFTVTAKGVLPAGRFEFYGGGGVGVYFATLDVEVTDLVTGLSVSDDDSDIVFGGHVVAGMNLNVTDRVFLGAEGKYVETSEASWEPFGIPLEDTDLDGYTVTGNIGFRF